MVSIDDIQEQFDETLDIQLGDETTEEKKILEKLRAMCEEFSKTAESIAYKWDAYKYSHRNATMNLDTLEVLRKSLRQEKAAKATNTSSHDNITHLGASQSKEYNKDTLGELENMYGNIESPTKTHKVKVEKNNMINNKRRTESSFVSTPAKKPKRSHHERSWSQASPAQGVYKMRQDVGKIVTSFPITPNVKIKNETHTTSGARVTVELIKNTKSDLDNNKKSFRYMYEDADDIRDLMNERIERMLEEISQKHVCIKQSAENNKDDEQLSKENVKNENNKESDPTSNQRIQYSNLSIPRPDAIYVGGRISAEEGSMKLKRESVFLEGERNISDNARLKLRLGQLQEYSLFPGQVVAIKGLHTGTGMAVEEIIPCRPKPHLTASFTPTGNTVRILTAAGPFTPAGNLSYAPLYDILHVTHNFKPDVLILIGPFVDCKQENIVNGKVQKTYEQLFSDLMMDVLKHTYETTKIIIAPSPDDMVGAAVFPQPPYPVPKKLLSQSPDRIEFYPNPATFKVDDVVFGVSTSNILFEIGKAELVLSTKKGERLKRHAKHLINQQSYYPLHATMINRERNVGDNVDYTHLDKLVMDPCPDVLILPSNLKYFIQNIEDDVVSLNPGLLSKGQGGGTYAEIIIHPIQKEAKSTPKNIHASITARTNIDIRRI